MPEINGSDIVIDALFGSGLSKPLTGLSANIVKHINRSEATVIAIDIPSGLYGEKNGYDTPEAIIQADYTLTFGLPKLSFFFAENEQFVGKWHVLNIHLMHEAIDQQESRYWLTELSDIASTIPVRKKFSHKGYFGHALLMAGSYGRMGAAILAAKACLRSGAGLLTTHIVSKGYEIMQTAVPEAMVTIDPATEELSCLPDLSKFTAIGIGPGIGVSDPAGFALYQLLKNAQVPLILDADAINLLAAHTDWLGLIPENTMLTPHPGEFDRLTGLSKNGYERHLKQIEFSIKHKVIVVLKGAYTSVTAPSGSCQFNSTGNPGMATAGSGDVLTGIILSLLAQGYNPVNAALTGVYLHGLAGDLACEQTGEEALIASDIINYLGKSFKKIKNANEL
jgi:NAD(P)H-hydrate epimerase